MKLSHSNFKRNKAKELRYPDTDDIYGVRCPCCLICAFTVRFIEYIATPEKFCRIFGDGFRFCMHDVACLETTDRKEVCM